MKISFSRADTQHSLLGTRDVVIVGLAIILFLALSLTNITLPGLYYDEALDVVPAMQLLYGTSIEPVRGAALILAGHTLPLMIMDYVGTVNTYLALPLFALLGVNVTSVRLLPIVLAAVCLVLSYRLARRLFDWRVAAFTILLAGVDPSFVFFSRMGIHVTSVMSVFALGSLLAFLNWRDSGQRRWLLLGGLLLGLGLWAKVLFLWWIVALGVAWATAHGLEHGWRGRDERAANAQNIGGATAPVVAKLASVTAGLLIGSSPLWIYNLMTGGTLTALGRNALVTEHGVSNLNVIGNLIAAVASFRVLLEGSYFWFQGGQFANGLNVIGLVVAVVTAPLLIYRRPEWRQALILIATLIVIVVAESAFTVSGIWATHLYILLPLPQMVMGVAGVLLADMLAGTPSPSPGEGRNEDTERRHLLGSLPLTRRGVAQAVLGLALVVGMAANLSVDLRYHAEMVRSGGLSRFSDAIYDLAGWLDSQQFDAVYAVDWGIQKNIQVLTQGRVNPIEISGFAGEAVAAFEQRADMALRDARRAVYVFHSREDTVYELYPAFQATANRLGIKLKIIEATHDRSGAPVHVMWARE